VAAVASGTISNERIFSYKHLGTWNDMRHRVMELYPERGIVKGKDQEIHGRNLSSADEPIQRSEEILKEFGRSGYISVDDIVHDFVASCYP
jgi:hypothetical protein